MNRMHTLCMLTYYTLALHLSSTYAVPWRLSISPAEFLTISHGESESLVCQTEPPQGLVDCGFQLALPTQSPQYADAKTPNPSYGNLAVEFDGEGLAGGRCKLQLTASSLYKEESFPVGCRVRVAKGGWEYAYSSIVDTSWLPKEISLSTDPKERYLLPGSNLTVHCDSANHYQLEQCAFKLPGREKFNLTAASAVDGFRYVGAGLDKFQCGIFIPDVSLAVSDDDDSITCETYINYRKIPTRAVRVNTARCSSSEVQPEILSNNDGEDVVVRCAAPSCRPPAALLWYVNGSLAPSTDVSEAPDAAWRWQRDLQATVQTLTLGSASATGTTVKCVVEHVALNVSGSIVIPPPSNGSIGTLDTLGKRGTLGTVLIVCAVIFGILLVVAIVFFAKITKRWCFSQESRSHRTSRAERSSSSKQEQAAAQEAGKGSDTPGPSDEEKDALVRKESTQQPIQAQTEGN